MGTEVSLDAMGSVVCGAVVHKSSVEKLVFHLCVCLEEPSLPG